jgi:hypothetical protein
VWPNLLFCLTALHSTEAFLWPSSINRRTNDAEVTIRLAHLLLQKTAPHRPLLHRAALFSQAETTTAAQELRSAFIAMKLLDQARHKLRLLPSGWNTEQFDVRWIERFIRFHKRGEVSRHPPRAPRPSTFLNR